MSVLEIVFQIGVTLFGLGAIALMVANIVTCKRDIADVAAMCALHEAERVIWDDDPLFAREIGIRRRP